ncbi:MAG TPA: NAD(P)/FAD-dependent oxidoreductase [Pseudolabrys sp.]|nr:NAD(P)/FAD-dependent oxidoreductase [Pseudolabrys sp.]
MTHDDVDTVIVGGGAAGIAAGRRLQDAGVESLLVEARVRLGGRAWTVSDPSGFPIDLGCGWLHCADRNPWLTIAEQQAKTIDRTPPPWRRVTSSLGFPIESQRAFLKAQEEFFRRVDERARSEADVPAAALLEPACRWNPLINVIGTHISGAELERVSARDFADFEDNGVNWRIVEGYGATIAACGEYLQSVRGCAVTRIDHSGTRLRIETTKGRILADRVIVTLPTSIISQEDLFSPPLPAKANAARNLPLGLADKLFLSLEHPEEFEKDSRLFGATDRSATATYHLRPFGRPQIEAYFGGSLAVELEKGGEEAFFNFAVAELTSLLGGAFAKRLAPIGLHRWGVDPFSGGSYSYAIPGMADCRAELAIPVDKRLYFAGEACSREHFSTAHGAWITGVKAADDLIRAHKRR